jgi:Uma2 family endonuclease
MATETRISNEAYERLALAEPERKWELWDGLPREKPAMTFAHNEVAYHLGLMLGTQLDRSEYRVRVDASRVHRPASTYFVPDVFVFPVAYVTPRIRQGEVLEVYDRPLPLVVEIWSPSTGDYDVTEKLEVYKRRGDLEIWFIHPIARTLTAWCRQPDGSYEETVFTEGVVRPVALPGVAIDLAVLFNF